MQTEIRLVHDNFRRLQHLTLHLQNDRAGCPIFIDFPDGNAKLYITSAKNVLHEGGESRRVLYVDERRLAAHPLRPESVPPRAPVPQNAVYKGAWVKAGSNESGVAKITITMNGNLKGELIDKVAERTYRFKADLKAPMLFYGGELIAPDREPARNHMEGQLNVSEDGTMLEVNMRDLDVPGEFRLNLVLEFRGGPPRA